MQGGFGSAVVNRATDLNSASLAGRCVKNQAEGRRAGYRNTVRHLAGENVILAILHSNSLAIGARWPIVGAVSFGIDVHNYENGFLEK